MNKPTKFLRRVAQALLAALVDRKWIIFSYAVLSVVLSVSAGVRAGVMVGVAFAAGSFLAAAVGGGLRASLLGPTKQKVWGSVIAALLLVLGLWVGTHFAATFFGVYVSGPMWVVMGAVVCFLFVDKKTLRDSVVSEEREGRAMSAQEALQIFDAYGDAVAKFPSVDALMGKAPRDLRALPYPKERIKQALLTLLRLTPPGAAREPLEFGYVRLGDWQDTRVSDPTAAMLAEGKALLAELHSLGF